jgi:hypothetical protein
MRGQKDSHQHQDAEYTRGKRLNDAAFAPVTYDLESSRGSDLQLYILNGPFTSRKIETFCNKVVIKFRLLVYGFSKLFDLIFFLEGQLQFPG